MRAMILGLALLFAAATPAAAQGTDKAKAKALYERGLKHYNLAEYPDAIKAWKESYTLSKRPLLLFNIGQAYRLAGDCKLAMTFYDSYQREEPSPRNQDELDTALGLCAKALEAAADKQRSNATPPDDARGSDKAVPDKRPIDKAPIADKPDRDEPDDDTDDKQVADAPDDGEQVDEPEDTMATTTGGGMRKAGIAVGVVGAVLGGVGVYFALDSASAARDLDGYVGEWTQEQVDLEARGERSAKLGWVMGGIGIAGIVAGGVMIAIGGPKSVETSDVAVVPTRGGAAVSWALHF